MRVENTEFKQAEPHEPQQATRMSVFGVGRVIKNIKEASLNTLGMVQRLPTDVASRGVEIRDEEKVDNNVVPDEDLVVAFQTRNLELEAENEALRKEKDECTRLLNESLEKQAFLRSTLNDSKRKIDEYLNNQHSLHSSVYNYRQRFNESHNEVLSLQRVLYGKDEALRRDEERIRSLTDEVGKLQQKELALRKIILDKAGSEKVSDQTMVLKFITLRQKIQYIARLHHYHMDQSLSKKMEESDMPEFFEEQTWGHLTTGDRINRVRSKIFEILDMNCLNFPVFGLEFCDSKDPIGGKDVDVASGLRVFEKLLKDHQVSAGVVSDWTVLTIDCIDKLDYRGLFVSNLSAYIYDFFTPLLANQTSRQDEDEIRSKITELCDEAIGLRMLMRKSRGLYMVKVPGLDGLSLSASACGETLVQPFGVEGGKNSEAGDEIAHTLFGALVKQPEHGDGRELVLEVAHVILKKEKRSLRA